MVTYNRIASFLIVGALFLHLYFSEITTVDWRISYGFFVPTTSSYYLREFISWWSIYYAREYLGSPAGVFCAINLLNLYFVSRLELVKSVNGQFFLKFLIFSAIVFNPINLLLTTNVIRQGMAVGLILYCINLEKTDKKALLLMAVAFFVHNSSLLFFVAHKFFNFKKDWAFLRVLVIIPGYLLSSVLLELFDKSTGITRQSNTLIYSVVIVLPVALNLFSYQWTKNSRFLDSARNSLYLLSPFIFIGDENVFERLALAASWMSIFHILMFTASIRPKYVSVALLAIITSFFYASLYLFPQITTQISVFNL